jgi:hypothetical protein
MSVKLIVFLTKDDKTVPNALEIFSENKHSPAPCWGFKDTGIDLKPAKELYAAMKNADKIVFFESLAENEEEGLEAAKFAVEINCDYLIGMPYFNAVHELLKKNGIKFFPTCGARSGIPRMLHGSISDVVNDGKKVRDKDVDGLCLSMYRFTGGDPEKLAEEFVDALDVPVIVTGSINDEQRLDVIKRLNPWGITIGSAFFNNSFGEGLSFGEQIDKVTNYLLA